MSLPVWIFLASDAVKWLMVKLQWSSDQCIFFGRLLRTKNIIHHVSKQDQKFHDDSGMTRTFFFCVSNLKCRMVEISGNNQNLLRKTWFLTGSWRRSTELEANLGTSSWRECCSDCRWFIRQAVEISSLLSCQSRNSKARSSYSRIKKTSSEKWIRGMGRRNSNFTKGKKRYYFSFFFLSACFFLRWFTLTCFCFLFKGLNRFFFSVELFRFFLVFESFLGPTITFYIWKIIFLVKLL